MQANFKKSWRRNSELLTIPFLLAVVVFIYWPSLGHDFIFDDGIYVLDNPFIQKGLSFESLIWSFKDAAAISWHPMTWLSLIVDYECFGMNPAGYNVTNMLLHAISGMVLFFALRRMSGAFWPGFLAAAIFAAHPINVETVALASQRKTLLCALFWMLAMWSYVRYGEKPNLPRYLLVTLFFALGLMSKLAMVTFPMAMLLLDYWPLRRFGWAAEPSGSRGVNPRFDGKRLLGLFLEKVPWLTMSAILTMIMVFMDTNEQLESVGLRPMGLRIANALVTYVLYVWKMIWPARLAIWYPFPNSIPLWETLGAALLLTAVSAAVFRSAFRRPYLVVGWLWFLGVMFPAAGLIQSVVWPAMADHHAYLPAVGLFIMAAWGGADLAAAWSDKRVVLGVGIMAVIVSLSITARVQAELWRDPLVLYQHALDVTKDNWLARSNLGRTLNKLNRQEEALPHFMEALRVKPDLFEAHLNCCGGLLNLGRLEEAAIYCRGALRLNPDSARALSNMGAILVKSGHPAEAIPYYEKALRIRPDLYGIYYNLGLAFYKMGAMEEARLNYQKALDLKPAFPEAREALAGLEEKQDAAE